MRWKESLPLLFGLAVVLSTIGIIYFLYKPKRKEGFQSASSPTGTTWATLARRGTFIKSDGTGNAVFWKPLNQQIRQPVTSCTQCSGTNVCDFVKTVSNSVMNSLTASTAFDCASLTGTPPTINPQGVGFFFQVEGTAGTFFKRFTENKKYSVGDVNACFDIYPDVSKIASTMPAAYGNSIPTDSQAFNCSFLTEIPAAALKTYEPPLPGITPYDKARFYKITDEYEAYQEYEDELTPPEEDPPEAPLPDFPPVTEFDPGAIPWDAENKDIAKEEILWGIVSPNASQSIFNRVYHQSLLDNPNNLQQDGRDLKYMSPTFRVQTDSTTLQGLVELSEAVTMQAAPVAAMAVAGYAAPYASAAVSRVQQAASVAIQNVSTQLQKVGPQLKGFGRRKVRILSSKGSGPLKKKFAAKLIFIKAKNIVLNAIPVVGNILFTVLDVMLTAAGIIVPPILEQFMHAEGFCPVGYTPLDAVLPEYANMILAFIPVFGDLLDLLYPYACFNNNADMKFKETVVEPPYYENQALSIYYHPKIPISNSYRPPNTAEGNTYTWCDFSSDIMLNRMAQYYYDQAFANPQPGEKEDTITVSYISKILTVAASSEFSCDILCEMTTVEFNALTNENFTQKITRGEDGQGHDRRFYFEKFSSDPAKVYTVTGCTHEDGTGPTAYDGLSLPFTFNITVKPTNPNAGDAAKSALLGIATNAAAASIVGTAGTIAMEKTGTMDNIRDAIGLGQKMDTNTNPYSFDKLGNQVNDYEYYIINVGMPVTQAIGVVPDINFCGRASRIADAQCADSRFLKLTIDKYHAENPRIRIKEVQKIEARGVGGAENGCYYKWVEAAYDPATNLETNPAVQERVLRYKIPDYRTCVWAPDAFVPFNATTYAPRVQRDINNQIVQPTRTFPRRPFKVPPPIPVETTLGGSSCPTTMCSNKAQLERVISQFNTQNPDRKILKVLRVVTPASDRCDIDAEVLRIGAPRIAYRDRIRIQMRPAPSTAGTCVFDYASDSSNTPNSGTFIQDNTPDPLGDISGGVGFINSFLQTLRNSYNSVLASFIPLKASEKTQAESDNARKTTSTAFEQVYMSQTLDGCPTKKCSDPDILNAIMTQYNIENNPKEQFSVTKETMTQVLKAGIASSTECDILFANKIELFDDILYPPTEVKTIARAMRFPIEHKGNCRYTVVPKGAFDVSGSAIGLRSESTTLDTAYTGPACQVNCRAPEVLRAVAAKYGEISTTGGLKQFIRSYQKGQTECEYKFTKDYTITEDGATTTIPNTESFLKANFTITSGAACGTALESIQEFFPENIEPDEEDESIMYMDGKQVDLPFLMGYELNTVTSPNVNTTVVSRPF